MSSLVHTSEIRARARCPFFWRDLALAYLCAIAFGALGASIATGVLGAFEFLARMAFDISLLKSALAMLLIVPMTLFLSVPLMIMFVAVPALLVAAPMFLVGGLCLPPRHRVIIASFAATGLVFGAIFVSRSAGERLQDTLALLLPPLTFFVCMGQALWRRCLERRLGPPPPGRNLVIRMWRGVPLWGKAVLLAPFILSY